MEDEIFYINENNFSISAVFDGHGGGECSKFLKTYFVPLFLNLIKKQKMSIKKSLQISIEKIHCFIIKYNITTSGSTCNILVIDYSNQKYYIANVGDSRTIFISKQNTISQITQDHKPNLLKEYRLICSKGGYVENNRVNGQLSMSRAIGDCEIAQYLCSKPDIYEGSLNNCWFFVQASDGLFEKMSNYEIGYFIIKHIQQKYTYPEILKKLVNYSLNIKYSNDNISIILILI